MVVLVYAMQLHLIQFSRNKLDVLCNFWLFYVTPLIKYTYETKFECYFSHIIFFTLLIF